MYRESNFWLNSVSLAGSRRFASYELRTMQNYVKKTEVYFWRRGMSISAVETHPLAQGVEFTDDDLIVSLVEGRKIAIPLVWFPRLARADKVQLNNYELLGDGEGIHWPDVDEDLSVAGLLRGDH